MSKPVMRLASYNIRKARGLDQRRDPERIVDVLNTLDADVVAYEPIWLDGKVQGFCTSGGYAHHAGKSIALGFVPTDRATAGLEVEIEIMGQMRPARLITTPLFDADSARMRG